MSRRKVVIDTNVLVVANGRQTTVGDRCQLACIEALIEARDQQVVCVDVLDRIMTEYSPYANYSGSPGVGDLFFRYVFDNQHVGSRVQRVAIDPIDDESRGYDQLPQNALKAGDRAILAVAVAADAQVVNATDSDWHEQDALMKGLKVPVVQLCPEEG